MSEQIKPTMPVADGDLCGLTSAPRERNRLRGVLQDRMIWFTTPLITVVFLLLWDAYVTIFDVSPFVLPRPGDVLVAVRKDLSSGYIYTEFKYTLIEILIGFLVAVVFGILCAIVFAKMPLVDRLMRPFIIGAQVVPKVALVPLFIVWFGFGPTSKIVVAAIIAFFPVFTNALLGFTSIPEGYHDLMSTVNASRRFRFMKLELPSALPYILSGMEMAIVLSTVGAVVTEFLGGSHGLGFVIVQRLNSFQITGLWSGLIIMTVMGFILYACVTSLKHAAIPWHESVRGRRK